MGSSRRPGIRAAAAQVADLKSKVELATYRSPRYGGHVGPAPANAPGIRHILEQHDDANLHRLMTNLGGHDLPTVLQAFAEMSGALDTLLGQLEGMSTSAQRTRRRWKKRKSWRFME